MKQIIFTTISILIFGISSFAQTEKSPCPTIEVRGRQIEPGKPMDFSVKLSEESNFFNLEYQWTVSKGKIIEGQRTSSIKVDFTGMREINITATVEVKGLPSNCPSSASETGSLIIDIPESRLFDEFGKLPVGAVKARIDYLYLKISNEPNSQGYIINYGTDKEIAAREKQIQQSINFRKYDPSRVTIVRGGKNPNGAGVWTKVFILPPGADNPQP